MREGTANIAECPDHEEQDRKVRVVGGHEEAENGKALFKSKFSSCNFQYLNLFSLPTR